MILPDRSDSIVESDITEGIFLTATSVFPHAVARMLVQSVMKAIIHNTVSVSVQILVSVFVQNQKAVFVQTAKTRSLRTVVMIIVHNVHRKLV